MKTFFFIGAIAAIGLASWSSQGRADTVCDRYRESSPELYKVMCSGTKSASKPAGANSTFSDSFNINTATLPTEPSSLGIETIGSYLRNRNEKLTWAPTFSLIKGFHRFGTGISTSGNNTFFGNDVIQRTHGLSEVDSFEPHELARSNLPNINVGTSMSLMKFNGGSMKLGLSGRYNKTTDSFGGGPGVIVYWKRFTLGAGYTRERVSNFLPRITFVNFMAGARVFILEFQYMQLRNNGGVDLQPIHIIAATAEIRRLTLTLASRRLNYLREGDVVQNHFAVQYLFSKRFSAGFLFNYIPGASSLGTQFYL